MRKPGMLVGTLLVAAMSVACSAAGPGSAPPASTTPSMPGPPTAPQTGTSPSNVVTSMSGVEGRTMVDGGCPVEIEGSPCPARPISARVTVLTAMGGRVAETTSDPEGNFRIALDPGQYRLQAANLTGAAYPRSAEVTVVVDRDRYTQVIIEFDSGIQ